MSFLSKLFGRKNKPSQGEGIRGSKAIPQSELALDADIAGSLIAGSGIGGTAIGLSADWKRVLFVTKQSLSTSEINGLREAIEQGRVKLGHRLFEMPTYPVFVVKVTILDHPSNPLWLETFPDVGGSDRMILQRLRGGGRLAIGFHFYGPTESLLFRAGYESSFLPSPDLGQEIVKAEMYLESLPHSMRNYPAAVQQVIRENP